MTKDQTPPDAIILPGRIPPHEIGFLNALLDDHEGIVVVRTVDSVEGRMEFWVAPGLMDEFMQFVRYAREHLNIPVEIGDPIAETTEFADLRNSSLKSKI